MRQAAVVDVPTLKAMGFEAQCIRGKVYVKEMRVNKIMDGVLLNYTRRHYGNGAFYCWVEALFTPHGEWESLGDPWPSALPKGAEVMTEIQKRKATA